MQKSFVKKSKTNVIPNSQQILPKISVQMYNLIFSTGYIIQLIMLNLNSCLGGVYILKYLIIVKLLVLTFSFASSGI